jgi:phenylpyruvate tautomerase PptA (4-oxalocrotonate tautomerase family)
MRYKKVKKTTTSRPETIPVVGMLYIVEVKMFKRSTGEKTKQKLLLVGAQESDIESKLRWILDASLYDSFVIASVDKVREKVHVLSTVITQEKSQPDAVIDRGGRSENIYQMASNDRRQYAVGISTIITAEDEAAALRKVGHALINDQVSLSTTGASLPSSTTIIIEEVAKKSGYATARDVSTEKNRASFVRG